MKTSPSGFVNPADFADAYKTLCALAPKNSTDKNLYYSKYLAAVFGSNKEKYGTI